MRYRILVARNGYYYVQKYNGLRWMKIGHFYRTRLGAERLIAAYKNGVIDPNPRVVAYY